ncbi:hypothetical protein CA51_06240 [Rosistilla oblonga]|uniref:hypothetical protein n=1 Tax=Rosistilla oblonga TaxID=2527990 RepID=UPI00118B073E|nr:hypothetical protein [Rosistilla oblonga]QDV10770.1 hypothetical protein CA51_06240 [Rosistilla oblonga]
MQPEPPRPDDNASRDNAAADELLRVANDQGPVVVDPAGAASSEPPVSPEPSAAPEPTGSLIDTLLFGLSLPERSARTVSALVGGLASESAARLIPTAFRSSKSYRVFVQQSLDFVIHDVGGVVSHKPASEDAQAEGLVARQTVGGMLDFAGVATLHMSPMTVLAIISDVAYGSSTYMRQLSEELKRKGLIDQESTIDHVTDLIDALQETSVQGADALNAPPINLEGLQQTIDKTRAALNRIDPTTTIPQAEIKRIWQEMETAATKAETSVFDVATTMTMFSMNRLSLVSQGALSSVVVAGNLIDQHIVGHYADALTEIQVRGLWTTLAESSQPYLEAIWNNFDETKSTLTQDLLNGTLIGKAWGGLIGWWRGADKNKTPPAEDSQQG